MKVLILGGTVFLSREVATVARDRGHDVTCAARGLSGRQPDGVRFVPVDRSRPRSLAALGDGSYDAVVDVIRQSVTQVRDALVVLSARARHWTYVSTRSVYADKATLGQDATAAVVEPAGPDVDEQDPQNYGELKVAAERAVLTAREGRAFIPRPGLIVGRGDVSDRYGYWPARLARGGEVLCPGRPDAPVQVIDVRDLAEWIVLAAEENLTGTFDATAPPMSFGEVLSRTAAAVYAGSGDDGDRAGARLTWVDNDFLLQRDVQPWAGERSLPLWLPQPELAAMGGRDVSAALAAGLTIRPLEDTAADALRWERELGVDRVRRAGLRVDEEAVLLSEWHAVRAGYATTAG